MKGSLFLNLCLEYVIFPDSFRTNRVGHGEVMLHSICELSKAEMLFIHVSSHF